MTLVPSSPADMCRLHLNVQLFGQRSLNCQSGKRGHTALHWQELLQLCSQSERKTSTPDLCFYSDTSNYLSESFHYRPVAIISQGYGLRTCWWIMQKGLIKLPLSLLPIYKLHASMSTDKWINSDLMFFLPNLQDQFVYWRDINLSISMAFFSC